MDRTLTRFEERKAEVEFYFSVLTEILKPDSTVQVVDNHRFGRMLKSNFLLMLYNLIESCIRSGFEEIYEAVESEGIPYKELSDALRDIWSSYEISKAVQETATKRTYSKRVKEIINHVISQTPLVLPKDALDICGNLDAKQIRELLQSHNIIFLDTNAGEKHRILLVKAKRNSLAHGDESFDEAARELTLDDLEAVKDEVLVFINDVLSGMKRYYDQRLFAQN